MARKRIKSLAKEWGVPLEDVIASCERLKLAHAHTEASLLGQDEADRVKADLDEQAHREAILRKETVLETSAGTVVEKRLNATVMRRRHAEGATGPSEAAQPFHFESPETSQEDTFGAPFMEEGLAPQPETASFEPVSRSRRNRSKPPFQLSRRRKAWRPKPGRNHPSNLSPLKLASHCNGPSPTRLPKCMRERPRVHIANRSTFSIVRTTQPGRNLLGSRCVRCSPSAVTSGVRRPAAPASRPGRRKWPMRPERPMANGVLSI